MEKNAKSITEAMREKTDPREMAGWPHTPGDARLPAAQNALQRGGLPEGTGEREHGDVLALTA